MIHPDKVKAEARKREDELDRQFLRLHKELFAGYDCNNCRKMEAVSWVSANRIPVKSILIQTSRSGCGAC